MRSRAHFHFYARLKQFVKGAAERVYLFNDNPAIKDSIEALGVPHTEVDLILANGRSVDFRYSLQDEDFIAVFPFGQALRLDRLQHLSPALSAPLRFILDVHLGKLARRLRMLGFDCRYRNDYSDAQIIESALRDELIILTRDRGILKHSCVKAGYLIGSERVAQQVEEVLDRYDLRGAIGLKNRCPRCNSLLKQVEKTEIEIRLKPKTALYYDLYYLCAGCGQLYWKGSHYRKIARWRAELGLERHQVVLESHSGGDLPHRK